MHLKLFFKHPPSHLSGLDFQNRWLSALSTCFPKEAQLLFSLPAPTVCKHQAWEQQCHCSATYTSLLNLAGLLILTQPQQFIRSKAERGQIALEGIYAHREHSTQEGDQDEGFPPRIYTVLKVNHSGSCWGPVSGWLNFLIHLQMALYVFYKWVCKKT